MVKKIRPLWEKYKGIQKHKLHARTRTIEHMQWDIRNHIDSLADVKLKRPKGKKPKLHLHSLSLYTNLQKLKNRIIQESEVDQPLIEKEIEGLVEQIGWYQEDELTSHFAAVRPERFVTDLDNIAKNIEI